MIAEICSVEVALQIVCGKVRSGLIRRWTGSGIIEDDSFKCIELKLNAVCDKGGYTEIEIEELNQKCTTRLL